MAGILFDKICAVKTLWRAWEKVKEKGAGGGIDHISLEYYERNLDKNLNRLGEMLRRETYVPEPVRRTYIPKEKTSEKRAIGISCIKDKIVQQAVKRVIEPLFEKVFLKCSFGFRPQRGPQGAIRQVDRLMKTGNNWVANLDVDNFFDCIDHSILINRLAEKIDEEPVLRLIELWIKMGVVEKTEWLDTSEGVPQGNVLSPLLSNIYLHPFDIEMTAQNYNYIRYADDFVILCQSRDDALRAFKHSADFLLRHLRLRLNKENQPYRHIRDGFAFLGFFFKGRRKAIADAKIRKIKDRIPRILNEHSAVGIAESIKKLNESITGWRQYYSLGDTAEQFKFLDNILFYKLSAYLKRNMTKDIGTAFLRDAIYKIEFFLKKSNKERERLLELIIAHARISPKEQPAAAPSENQVQPIPVSRAVKQKKEEYREILCRNSSLIITEAGSFVEKSGNRIMVFHQGKKIREIPLFRLKGAFILSSSIKISAVAIKYCALRQIPVHFIDPRGKTYAAAYNPDVQKSKFFPAQPGVAYETRSLKLAAAILRGKILNQVNLLRHFRNDEDIELEFKNECAASLKEMDSLLQKLELSYKKENLPEIKGMLTNLRDRAHSSYWRAVKALLHRYVYLGKKRDNSPGLVNALLDFGNGILYSKVLGIILTSTGFHDRTDFLYNPAKTKSTLIYEVSSLLRQAMVDKVIFEMLRNNEQLEMNALILSPKTRGKLASAILNKLDEKRACRNRPLSYSDIIRQQSRNINACIEKGDEFEAFVERYHDS